MSKKILVLIFVILLLITIPIGVYLVKQKQEIRKKAAGPEGTTDINLNPAVGNFNMNQTFAVDIQINTHGIQVDTVQIIFNASAFLNVEEVAPQQIAGLNWQIYRINDQAAGDQVQLLLNAPPGETFQNSSFTTLAILNLEAADTGTAELKFDQILSKILIAGQDILLTPIDGSYTIGTEEAPTATPTLPEATATPTTILPEATATPTEPAGATNTPTPTQSAGNPTNTPTTRPTATPTTASGGGGGTTSNPVSLSSISASSNPPTFSGTAAPGAKITITVQSTPITGTVYADAAGNWSWTPPSELETGSHTATVTATDSSGQTTTDSVSFTIADAEDLPATGFLTPTVLSLLSGLLLLFLGLAL